MASLRRKTLRCEGIRRSDKAALEEQVNALDAEHATMEKLLEDTQRSGFLYFSRQLFGTTQLNSAALVRSLIRGMEWNTSRGCRVKSLTPCDRIAFA